MHQLSPTTSETQAPPQAAAQKAVAPEAVHSPSFIIQPKLTVGAPDDPLEHEADEMAAKVMRMPQNAFIQRQCAHCQEEEEKEGAIRRKPLTSFIQAKSNGSQPAASESVTQGIESTRGSGTTIDAGTRSFMESSFGASFSNVQIHNDSTAASLSSQLNAQAFTVGNDIYFNEGKYSPHTGEGRRLLAHELTHTLQQGGGHTMISREPNALDPWEVMQGNTEGTVSSIIVDKQSMRTRFFTLGGNSLDGILQVFTKSFPEGEYMMERNYGPDASRYWNIFFPDGKNYPGGLQFQVLMNEGIRFESISYTKPLRLQVVSGMLPKLIDIKARIKEIRDLASKTWVGTKEEEKIITLLTDIPAEQSHDFMAEINNETMGGVSLLDKLDSVVDEEENMMLHQAISQLRLRAKAKDGAPDLSHAPVLAWHDVMGFFEQSATFRIDRMPNGKIKIKYMGGISSGLYSSPDYQEIADMDSRTRLNWMAGGVEVDADSPVIIHDYDRDKFVVLTAQDLISYQHSGKRKFIQDTLTIASLATPVGAETALGRAAVITFEKVLPGLVMLVEENKLNIRKWFPNWGPAILKATEVVKIGIALYGAGQFVKGSYGVLKKLRDIRRSRLAMDGAKAIADTPEEIAQAERIASQLEKQADDVLAQADKARKEMGLAAENAVESGAATTAKSAASIESAAGKTAVIDDAINSGKFNDEAFARMVNKELSNPRVQLSKRPGYELEVPIGDTGHSLARQPNGKWCLFSEIPKGCGSIPIAQNVDELFAQISTELKMGPPKIGSKGKVDISKAITDAQDAGWVGQQGELLGVDLAVQPHSTASDARRAFGVSGKDVQSAHASPSSVLKNIPGYSREGALTILMPRAMHKQFDDYWKAWSIAQRHKGITEVPVRTFLTVMDEAIMQTPGLSKKTKGAITGLIVDEFLKMGLKFDDKITLPYPNVK
jgi:hypothetical protein